MFNFFGKKQPPTRSQGKKEESIFKKGWKWVGTHADPIKRVADSVASVAGTIGDVASAALPFTAEIPIVGEVVAGAAAGGKLIQAGAKGVSKVAGAAGSAYRAEQAAERALGHAHRGIDDARHHRWGAALSEGVQAVEEGKTAYTQAQAARKSIQRKK
tara:strand:+ start:1046 stop:1519 length:474 start_codon:yes stop_codon:yes gene_type:complete